MFTKSFWIAAFERAIKTAGQSALLVLGMSDTGFGNLFDVDGMLIIGWAAGGAVLSLLTSIASGIAPVGPKDSPSVTKPT